MRLPEKPEFGNPEHIKIVKTLAKRNEDRKKDNEDTLCGSIMVDEHYCDCDHCESDVATVSVHYECFNCSKENSFDDDVDFDDAKYMWSDKELSCQSCGAKHIVIFENDEWRQYDTMNVYPLSYDEVVIVDPNQLKMKI
jgi:DNA-directed RNA polymerase subunit RPC12/RpoP